MRRLILVALIVVAGCGERGAITLMPSAKGVGTSESIFIGTTRGPDPETGEALGRARSEKTTYMRMDVSVPPDRTDGDITWPKPERQVDPTKDFVTLNAVAFDSSAAFRRNLSAALARQKAAEPEAIIFVHGFDNNFAEGVYRLAQLGHDLKLKGTLVHYSWPSRASALGYVYDRDSVMFARDGLTNLINQVRAAGARRIIIVAHSMGSLLVMESLRDLAIAKDRATLSRIAAVALLSPDMDVDVFRQDAQRIGPLPQPFMIFTSTDDKALRLSAFLTGQSNRVGNLASAANLSDLKVTIIDTTAYSTGMGHFNIGDSPELLRLMTQLGSAYAAMANDQSRRTGFLGGAVLTVQNATQVILSPVAAIADQ